MLYVDIITVSHKAVRCMFITYCIKLNMCEWYTWLWCFLGRTQVTLAVKWYIFIPVTVTHCYTKKKLVNSDKTWFYRIASQILNHIIISEKIPQPHIDSVWHVSISACLEHIGWWTLTLRDHTMVHVYPFSLWRAMSLSNQHELQASFYYFSLG